MKKAAKLGEIVKETFEEITARFTDRFLRSESRTCFVNVLRASIAPITRPNGWQIAEVIGDATPYGVQAFFLRHRWEPDDVRDDLQKCVVDHFGDDDGVFIGDETGFLKKGVESAGVGKQYTGKAGGIVNCQSGVFLAYKTLQGMTMLVRVLYLQKEWIDDLLFFKQKTVYEMVGFQTKQQMFLAMLERA